MLSILPKKIISIPALLLFWLTKGIWEEWVFGRIVVFLENRGLSMGVITLVEQYQNIIVPTIAIMGIVGIAIWSGIDIRKRRLYRIIPILKRMEKCMLRLASTITPRIPDLTQAIDVDTKTFSIGEYSFKQSDENKDFNEVIEEFKSQLGAITNKLKKDLEGRPQLLDNLPLIFDLNLVISCAGYGFKLECDRDKEYKKLVGEIERYCDHYESMLSVKTLKLIQLYMMTLNSTLAVLVVKREPIFEAMFSLTIPTVIKLVDADFEELLKSAFRIMRVAIADSIRELERKNGQ